MGRGDKRSRKGKIFKGSYGNTRKQRTARPAHRATSAGAPAAAKKAPVSKKGK